MKRASHKHKNTYHLVSQFTGIKLMGTSNRKKIRKGQATKRIKVTICSSGKNNNCLQTIPPLLLTPSPGPQTSYWTGGSHSNATKN
jgi:hypothetical protein